MGKSSRNQGEQDLEEKNMSSDHMDGAGRSKASVHPAWA